MALTRRGDGTGTAFQVSSVWWNDYYDLLTGAMTDQPVSLKFTPGSSSANPVLKLTTSTNADMLQGYNGATKNLVITQAGVIQDGSGNNYALIKGSGATGGRQIFVGTTTPTGANEGDIWIKA